MNFPTEMTTRSNKRREEETMHLFDANARAVVSILDLTTVQGCLGQFIDGIPIRNICRTYMTCAACWAGGHCRRLVTDASLLRSRAQRLHERDAKRYRNSVKESDLEADLLPEQTREHRHLAGRLEYQYASNSHVTKFLRQSNRDRYNPSEVAALLGFGRREVVLHHHQF